MSHPTTGVAESSAVGGLEALAVRCEQATGPDRELDAAIYVATAELPEGAQRIWAKGTNIFWAGGSVNQGPLYLSGRGYPHFASSIDAAMTLVKHHEFEVGSVKLLGVYYAVLTGIHDEHRAKGCKTPALALCAAALKARAALAKSGAAS